MRKMRKYSEHEILIPLYRRDRPECRIVEWLRTEGMKVRRGDPLLVLETDKATIELEAEVSGILSQIHYPAGVWIKAPAPVGVITINTRK
jgi:pyruvate dehydrogenase E2 component (dihydrolipoamide acetyltransferase)